VNDEKRNRLKGPSAIVAALALAGGAVAVAAFPGIASAGVQQTAIAEGACDGPEGVILLEIIDSEAVTYDVYIDDVLVDEDITDTDGMTIAYGPYANGSYNVVVVAANEAVVLDTDVTVDCAAETTTTAAPTTVVAVAAAAATAPTFTG